MLFCLGEIQSQDTKPAPSAQPLPPGAALPNQPGGQSIAQPVAQPVGPMAPSTDLGGGVTLSGEKTSSQLIENERPERVRVFPDDPESAWWEINPSYAFARAQREQKPLMLLFTGVWNTQAMALSQEVFSTKSFNEYVKENLVICYLNYPKNITNAPDSLRMVKKKFNVKGLPNVLLFNPSGEVHRGLRGYRRGKPIDYFGRLKVACRPVLASIVVQRESLERRGYRDWSNFLGKVIFAKYLRRDDSHVALLDVSGKEWYIPMNDLSPEGQKLVRSFPKGEKIILSQKK